MVHRDAETQLVDEEAQASFLVAHEDDDEVQAQIWISTVETEAGAIDAKGQFRGCHRRDYTRAVVRVSPTKSDGGGMLRLRTTVGREVHGLEVNCKQLQ